MSGWPNNGSSQCPGMSRVAAQLAAAPDARYAPLARRVDPASDGSRLLTCDGVSDLVRRQSARVDKYVACLYRQCWCYPG